VLAGLDAAGATSPTWVTVVLSATALVYAAGMRAFLPSGPIGTTLVWGSFLAGVLAVASAPEGSATALGLAIPLVQLLPSWGGAGLWILIAGIGILAVLVATFLEQGRTAIQAGLGRFSDETKEWE
jgi:hypothetical protein